MKMCIKHDMCMRIVFYYIMMKVGDFPTTTSSATSKRPSSPAIFRSYLPCISLHASMQFDMPALSTSGSDNKGATASGHNRVIIFKTPDGRPTWKLIQMVPVQLYNLLPTSYKSRRYLPCSHQVRIIPAAKYVKQPQKR